MKSLFLPLLALSVASAAACTDADTLYVGEEEKQDVIEGCQPEDEQTYYADADGDGFGDANKSSASCVALQGYVKDNTDCNDLEGFAYPGGLEVCGDEIDNDCSDGDSCVGSRAARWAFTAADGNTVFDESGFGLQGTLEGGLVNTSESNLYLDGVDDYALFEDMPLYQLEAGSIALWFYPGTTGVQQALLSKDANGNGAGGHLTIYLDVGGSVRAVLQSANQNYTVATEAVSTGAWHHLVFSFGGNEGMSLQVDGGLAGVDPYTGGLVRNYEPLVIGASTDTSGPGTATPISKPFEGLITEVQFYDRQLLEDEVLELSTATAPVGVTP